MYRAVTWGGRVDNDLRSDVAWSAPDMTSNAGICLQDLSVATKTNKHDRLCPSRNSNRLPPKDKWSTIIEFRKYDVEAFAVRVGVL
jgi:hypothetical protein